MCVNPFYLNLKNIENLSLYRLDYQPNFKNVVYHLFFFNPLSANVGYIRHDTVVTSDSCNSEHSQNSQKFLTFSCKSLKFSRKWYTKLCILGSTSPEKLRYKVKFSIGQKKALNLAQILSSLLNLSAVFHDFSS